MEHMESTTVWSLSSEDNFLQEIVLHSILELGNAIGERRKW